MGVTSEKKVELVAYELKCSAQIWFIQYNMERVDNHPLPWQEFKVAFLDHFFPIKVRKAKMMDFMNLKQGSPSVQEYFFKFTNLSKYAPTLVVEPWARMYKFVSGVCDLINEECCIAMLVREIGISHLMTYPKKIEGEKLRKKRMGKSNMACFEGRFQGVKSDGSGHFQQG